MKFRISAVKDYKENTVIKLSQILFENIFASNFKYVCVQYSKEMLPNGPLYGDFEIDVN